MILGYPEGPYTLFMELGPKKTIPVLVLGTSFHNGSVCGTLWVIVSGSMVSGQGLGFTQTPPTTLYYIYTQY